MKRNVIIFFTLFLMFAQTSSATLGNINFTLSFKPFKAINYYFTFEEWDEYTKRDERAEAFMEFLRKKYRIEHNKSCKKSKTSKDVDIRTKIITVTVLCMKYYSAEEWKHKISKK